MIWILLSLISFKFLISVLHQKLFMGFGLISPRYFSTSMILNSDITFLLFFPLNFLSFKLYLVKFSFLYTLLQCIRLIFNLNLITLQSCYIFALPFTSCGFLYI